jgi:integrase
MKAEMFENLPEDAKEEVVMHYGGCTIHKAFILLLERVAKILLERTYSVNELYEHLIYFKVLKPGYFREFKRLVKFGVREGIINGDRLISRTKMFRKLPNVFTKEQLVRFFYSCNDARIALACFLSFWCGFRTSEVIRIKVADIDFQNCLIKVVQSKRDKDRFVPFIPKIHNVVKKWLAYIGKSEYLFPSYESHSYATVDKHHISDRTLVNGFNEALKKAGLDTFDERYANGRKRGKPTFYALRHSFATHNIERRVPIELIQKAMGHDKIDTTIRSYTHIRDPVMVEAIAKAFEKPAELPAAQFRRPQVAPSSPVALLAQKFASGELSEEEFLRRKRVLDTAGL